jgi:hypothetical protein
VLPVQVSASCALVTVVHAPVPDAHAWQTPLHVALAQQYPSLQTPVEHCAFVVHAPPGLISATQLPVPSQ